MAIDNNNIYLKNTLTRKNEVFKPNEKNKVGMYNCGPTVYNRAHLGNLTAYIFADVMRRLFEELNFEVKQVINITDVGHLTDDGDDGEDKMESQAKKTGEKITSIAEKYTSLFITDLKKLNVEVEKILFPKATDHIKEQIDLIKKMENAGYVYKTSDGIYYNTKKYADYGVLGGINIKGLQEGARVEVNSEKNNPTDFALWKFSSKEDRRQQEWDSPWGVGFPGWHIECTAMSRKYLGPNFDIHTGGIEHIPVHHNNEIAQSMATDNKISANYWLHINHLMLNGNKISKSLGNVIFIDDLEKENVSPALFRYWFLTSHYSKISNFSWEAIFAAQKPFNRIIKLFVEQIKKTEDGEILEKNYLKIISNDDEKIDQKYYESALNYLKQNMSTPEAIAIISDILNDNSIEDDIKFNTIRKIDMILGMGFEKIASKNITEQDYNSKIPQEIIDLAEERKRARNNGDFEKADIIRGKITDAGYEIIDSGDDYTINKA